MKVQFYIKTSLLFGINYASSSGPRSFFSLGLFFGPFHVFVWKIAD